jgi:hypothetical protein
LDRQNGDDLQRIRFDDEDFIGDDEVTTVPTLSEQLNGLRSIFGAPPPWNHGGADLGLLLIGQRNRGAGVAAGGRSYRVDYRLGPPNR